MEIIRKLSKAERAEVYVFVQNLIEKRPLSDPERQKAAAKRLRAEAKRMNANAKQLKTEANSRTAEDFGCEHGHTTCHACKVEDQERLAELMRPIK
jgi:hypothetical protein